MISKEDQRLIPIAVLILYSFAYVYFKGLYSQFNIKFEFYITLNDLIFFGIEIATLLILGTILVYILIIIIELTFATLFIFGKSVFDKSGRFKNSNAIRYYLIFLKKKVSKILKTVLAAIFAFLITAAIDGVIDIPRLFYYAYPMLILIHLGIIKRGALKQDTYQFPKIIGALFFIYTGIFFISSNDALKIKRGENRKEITMKIDWLEYSSNKTDLISIGETSNYLFFYNKKTRESMIFNKEKMNLIKINQSIPEEKISIKIF